MTVHLTLTHEQAKTLATLLYSGCSIGAVNSLGFTDLSTRLNEEIGEFKFKHQITTFKTSYSDDYSIVSVDNEDTVYIDVT